MNFHFCDSSSLHLSASSPADLSFDVCASLRPRIQWNNLNYSNFDDLLSMLCRATTRAKQSVHKNDYTTLQAHFQKPNKGNNFAVALQMICWWSVLLTFVIVHLWRFTSEYYRAFWGHTAWTFSASFWITVHQVCTYVLYQKPCSSTIGCTDVFIHEQLAWNWWNHSVSFMIDLWRKWLLWGRDELNNWIKFCNTSKDVHRAYNLKQSTAIVECAT